MFQQHKLQYAADGASLYSTTDLATIVMRMQDYNPDAIIYLTDQRQSMHFVQVFRCARKTGLVGPDVELTHIGFGTMNGKDGKPFKTRDGGVMRLEYLLDEINEEMLKKITENQKEKENLDISEQGNLSVTVNRQANVSQPDTPFGGGQTVVTPQTQIDLRQSGGSLQSVRSSASLNNVVRALNALGATPMDLMSILQSMQSAGCLRAKLEII